MKRNTWLATSEDANVFKDTVQLQKQASSLHPQICSLMRGGIAERGGVRVGHRIIEINGQSVVAMAHEKIVQTLSVSVGEVRAPHAARWQFSLTAEPQESL